MAKSCLKCGHPVFAKGLCHAHWKQAHGKPLPGPKQPLKRQRAPIKKVSDKMALNLVIYRDLKKAWLPKHKVCEAQLPGCTQTTTEVHHMEGREGALLLDTTKWLGVCHNCHQRITEHSREAIELGLSLPRNRK